MRPTTLVIAGILITAGAAAIVVWDGGNDPIESSGQEPTASSSLHGPPPADFSPDPLISPNESLMAAATQSRAKEVAEPVEYLTPPPLTEPESFDEWPDAVRDVIAQEMGFDTIEEFDVKKKKGALRFEAVGRLPNGMEIELRTDADGNILERDVDIHPREMPDELMRVATDEIDPRLGDVLVESVEKRERGNGIHYEVRSKAGPWSFETQVDEQGRILDVKADYRPVSNDPDESPVADQP